MKDIGTDYEAKEQASQRQPTELYDFWTEPPFSLVQGEEPEGQTWHYTSGNVAVNLDGVEYTPAAIWRSAISFDADDATTKATIYAARPDEPVTRFIVDNPVELIWVRVCKLFRDLPGRMVPIFIGHVNRVGVDGAINAAECYGFEYYLRRSLLKWRWQKQCNHAVYDSGCGLDAAAFSVTGGVTVSQYGLVLTSSVFGGYPDGWFAQGFLEWDGIYRPIIHSAGDEIKILYAIPDLEDGAVVTAFAGCDHKAETCRDKFHNIENFLGFPDIPTDNPTLWSGGQRV